MSAKQRATERSEGGRTTAARARRTAVLTRQLVIRLDEETYTMLEQHAKDNDRTVAQSARIGLRSFLRSEQTAPAELARERFEESP